MPGFLYFLPGRQAATTADLLSAGLGYALDGRPFEFGPIPKGPGEQPGALIGITGDGVAVAYKPDAQDWQQSAGGYWVGISREAGNNRPGQADLRRKRFIAGEEVEMADGGKWTIPVARSVVRGSTLPRSLVLGPDNRSWQTRELPEFLAICADAEQIWQQLKTASRITLPEDEQMRIVLSALAVNYRIGPAEASLLGILTTENKWEILLALVDYNTIARVSRDLEKKSSHPGT